MYEPNSSTEYSESFDWDKQGANLYDENARKLNCKLEKGDIVVTGINSNNMGYFYQANLKLKYLQIHLLMWKNGGFLNREQKKNIL